MPLQIKCYCTIRSFYFMIQILWVQERKNLILSLELQIKLCSFDFPGWWIEAWWFVHANPVLVIQFSISPQLPRVIVLCFGARHIITLTVHLVTHVHNIWSSLYLLLYLRNLKLHRCPLWIWMQDPIQGGLGPISWKLQKLFWPVKPLQNHTHHDYRAVLSCILYKNRGSLHTRNLKHFFGFR